MTALSVDNDSYAQTTNTTYKKSTYTTSQIKKPTYNLAGTKYILGETYKTTGQPKVERNSSARKEFLKSRGYLKVPNGYQVDHIVPLSQGGRDVPSNMQLITIEQHNQKTATERRNVSSTYGNKTFNYSTRKSISRPYKAPSFNYSTPKLTSRSYKSPSFNYSTPKSTSRSYKAPSFKYSTPKSISRPYKASSFKYSTPKSISRPYKAPSFKYSAPKSISRPYKAPSFKYSAPKLSSTKRYSNSIW